MGWWGLGLHQNDGVADFIGSIREDYVDNAEGAVNEIKSIIDGVSSYFDIPEDKKKWKGSINPFSGEVINFNWKILDESVAEELLGATILLEKMESLNPPKYLQKIRNKFPDFGDTKRQARKALRILISEKSEILEGFADDDLKVLKRNVQNLIKKLEN
ncbi:MAG: DUF4259 domain-containing protein [Candidatus Peregrinibacteria bacterium]|nr:DUF4259 domain-containing protein [Candidatus Peregrinibacteria bacterium]